MNINLYQINPICDAVLNNIVWIKKQDIVDSHNYLESRDTFNVIDANNSTHRNVKIKSTFIPEVGQQLTGEDLFITNTWTNSNIINVNNLLAITKCRTNNKNIKMNRNDKCRCGSGLKYKHCCYGKD